MYTCCDTAKQKLPVITVITRNAIKCFILVFKLLINCPVGSFSERRADADSELFLTLPSDADGSLTRCPPRQTRNLCTGASDRFPLNGDQGLQAPPCQREEILHLLRREGLPFRGSLHFDEPPVAGANNIHINLSF